MSSRYFKQIPMNSRQCQQFQWIHTIFSKFTWILTISTTSKHEGCHRNDWSPPPLRNNWHNAMYTVCNHPAHLICYFSDKVLKMPITRTRCRKLAGKSNSATGYPRSYSDQLCAKQIPSTYHFSMLLGSWQTLCHTHISWLHKWGDRIRVEYINQRYNSFSIQPVND